MLGISKDHQYQPSYAVSWAEKRSKTLQLHAESCTKEGADSTSNCSNTEEVVCVISHMDREPLVKFCSVPRL